MRFIAGVGEVVPLLVGVFAAAVALTLILTPLVRRTVARRGIVDAPDPRRVNTSPVPRGGGVAVAAVFLVIAAIFIVVNDRVGLVALPAALGPLQLAGLLLGGALAAVIGALDDILDLRARWQFLGQVGVAVLAVATGLQVIAINNPFGSGTIPFGGAFAAAFTVVWVVGMINSINFIDGLDGLSSGIALIAAVTLGLLSLTTQVGQPLVAVLCFVFAGALLGFLRWNFHPASVFIGTAGVMFVGYTLAVLAILGTAKVAAALLVLGVPIIDTFWVIIRRLANGKSPFTPDRGHIHHRLLDLGLSHRQTVLLIYGICTALGIGALVVSAAAQVYAFGGVLVGSGLVLFLVTRGGFAREALDPETYDGGETDAGD